MKEIGTGGWGKTEENPGLVKSEELVRRVENVHRPAAGMHACIGSTVRFIPKQGMTAKGADGLRSLCKMDLS